MGVKKVELINPYKEEHIEKMNDFCLHNDLENVAVYLQKIALERPRKTNQEATFSSINHYLALFENDEIVDYCQLSKEKDTPYGFLSFPEILGKRNDLLVQAAVSYAFLQENVEEIFVQCNKSDHKLQKSLAEAGFISLGQEQDTFTASLIKEDMTKSKGNIRI